MPQPTKEPTCDLRHKLVDDMPGELTYIHACRICGREYGPEFTVYLPSTGKTSEPIPNVGPTVCVGDKKKRKLRELLSLTKPWTE